MLALIGDILNWSAAGLLFPLLLLPLGRLITNHSTKSTLAWVALASTLVVAGIVFAAAVPILRASPTLSQTALFAALFVGLALCILISGGPEKASRKIALLFETIIQRTGRSVMWLLLLMALVQFAVVLLRYVFGVNWIFMQDSVTYMHGAVFLLAAGYALITDDHVRVDIFYRDAPPKRKAIIDLIGTYLLLLPVCLLIVWTASPYIGRAWLVLEGSADTSGIQGVFILKTLISVFAILLAMAGFVVAHRAVETLKEQSR